MDSTIEQYLELLDQYQQAQIKLNTLFKEGFLSLSRANYAGNVQYGRDFYDETVQATKVVTRQDEEYGLQTKEGKDPIRMFGVLVPPSLRQSQQSFNEALEQVIQVLNLRQQVQTVGDGIEADEPNHTTQDEQKDNEKDISAQTEKTPLEKAPVHAPGASGTTSKHST